MLHLTSNPNPNRISNPNFNPRFNKKLKHINTKYSGKLLFSSGGTIGLKVCKDV